MTSYRRLKRRARADLRSRDTLVDFLAALAEHSIIAYSER